MGNTPSVAVFPWNLQTVDNPVPKTHVDLLVRSWRSHSPTRSLGLPTSCSTEVDRREGWCFGVADGCPRNYHCLFCAAHGLRQAWCAKKPIARVARSRSALVTTPIAGGPGVGRDRFTQARIWAMVTGYPPGIRRPSAWRAMRARATGGREGPSSLQPFVSAGFPDLPTRLAQTQFPVIAMPPRPPEPSLPLPARERPAPGRAADAARDR